MRQNITNYSIYCRSDCGPTFGGGNDLHISNSSNSTASCHSKLGHSYEHPQPDQGESYLAGSPKFQLSEIEVYQKE
jgi:hypothetical protein